MLVDHGGDEVERRDVAATDEDLAEPPVGRPLLLERLGELRLVEGAPLDEQAPERPPRLRLVLRELAGPGVVGGRELELHVDPALLGEGARQLGPGDRAVGDEDLAEPATGSLLLGQRVLEVGGADEALLDEEVPERPPGVDRLVHAQMIGTDPPSL
ncbi:MAG: hypothetical protein E6G42_02000 [Actinobacteria bacterium]|nr:MAG: hypothetical protein E6G42_02000 [Actinomycetota bacterium]